MLLLTLLIAMAQSQITIGIVDQNNFCMYEYDNDSMVPPHPGDNVGDTEGTSVAKCLGSVPGSDNAGALPSGLITSAHLIYGDGYVQITGSLDPSKYSFSGSDTGGQYDSYIGGSRPGSMCAGYPSYLEYLEPNGNIYCVRCCSTGDCNSSQDLAGCTARLGGNYGPGFDASGGPSPPPPSSSAPPPPPVSTSSDSIFSTSTASSTTTSEVPMTTSSSSSQTSMVPMTSTHHGNSTTSYRTVSSATRVSFSCVYLGLFLALVL